MRDNICKYPKHIENTQRNGKKTPNNSIKIWAEDLNTHFFQRRHTESQQVHEKMLNITEQQASQNHHELPPHTCQDGYIKKEREMTSVGKDVEKGEPWCTASRKVDWCSHYGKECEAPSKT